MTWQERYQHRFYGRVPGWLDGTEDFHRLCASKIRPGSRILEIGAGPSNPTSRFLATLGDLDGLDPDPAVLANDALSNARVLNRPEYPYSTGAFDYCVSNYVVEHVPNPLHHLREVKRILTPGGLYIFRTPNLRHYVAAIGRLTPHWVHEAVSNRMRALPAGAHDPYRTIYAMNSRRAIQRTAEAAGLEIELIRYVEKEPSYGRFSRVAFLAFMMYERIVNSTELFAPLRANLFVVLRA